MLRSPMTSVLERWRRLRQRRAFRWALDIAVVVGLFLGVSAWQARGHLRGEAPALSLPTLDGPVVSNASLAGKPTMVVFWAPWCGVCRAESPNISRVQSMVGDRAHVISVASDYEDLASVRAYVDDRDVDYPVLLGGDKTARAWGVRAFPSVFFLDGEGRITGSVVGYSTTAGLLARLLL